MPNLKKSLSLPVFSLFLCAIPALAADTGVLTINLRYAPQESVGSDSPTLLPGISERPVRLRVEDGRTVQDLAVIGQTTDDDDRLWDVRVGNSLTAWATEVLAKNAGEWGIRVDDRAPLTLAVKITRFKISESNKALGSTYNVDVLTELALQDGQGRTLWEGSAPGDATRYGKSRSEENINEVLSDGLKEAYAQGLADNGLQNAWIGKGKPTASGSSSSAAAAKPAESITPGELVNELIKLKKNNFGADMMTDFIQSKTLTGTLSADDLGKLKAAGVPEEVIKAALEHSKGR
jgi:uncharacterized lipoprotein YajG